MHSPMILWKLGCQGRLDAVVPGSLVHLVDQLSIRRFLVNTGASSSTVIISSVRTAPQGRSWSAIPC